MSGGTVFLASVQGTQRVGMGLDIADISPIARATFEQADSQLDFPLVETLEDDSHGLLAQTRYAQPALFTTSVAIARALEDTGKAPHAAAGFSLGEYAAHVIAGTVSFTDALALVAERAAVMADAAVTNPGGMVALIGTADEVQDLIEELDFGDNLVVANINSPKQTVVSGTHEALEHLTALWTENRGKAFPLATDGPFHAPAMRGAADALLPKLEATVFRTPRIPLVTNFSGSYLSPEPSETAADFSQRVAHSLYRQIFSPVQWNASMHLLASDGYTEFIEVGSGTVLADLMKRIDRSLTRVAVEDVAVFESLTIRGVADSDD